MANLNNISKEIKIGTQTIKASITREDVAGLYAQCGIDVEAALENILASELTAANFEKFAAGITAQNREGNLNSSLDDKEFTPTNIEDTEEFKRLSDKYKEEWIKYGRFK